MTIFVVIISPDFGIYLDYILGIGRESRPGFFPREFPDFVVPDSSRDNIKTKTGNGIFLAYLLNYKRYKNGKSRMRALI